jgi:lipopolysaccharide biosynthesis glycosyltransferase
MIEIACIADGAYLRHTGAMLHSALSHCHGVPVRVLVLHGAPVSVEDRARLQQVAAEFDASIELLHLDAGRTAHFPSGYFPRSVWFRVLLPELLPDSDKVLYLDSDLIVIDDLRPLWEINLGDHLLAAVTNPMYPFMPPYPRLKLGIDNPRDYFNSGVLLMNLRQMRAERTTEKLSDFARTNAACSWPDQDAFNVVCRGRWLALHPRWNMQSTLFELRAEQLPLPPEQVAEALRAPAVIHFIGPFKPWQYLCHHPYRGTYFEHARQTPWGVPELEGRSLVNAFLRRLPLIWIERWWAAERFVQRQWRRVRSWLVPPSAVV